MNERWRLAEKRGRQPARLSRTRPAFGNRLAPGALALRPVTATRQQVAAEVVTRVGAGAPSGHLPLVAAAAAEVVTRVGVGDPPGHCHVAAAAAAVTHVGAGDPPRRCHVAALPREPLPTWGRRQSERSLTRSVRDLGDCHVAAVAKGKFDQEQR